MRLPVNSLNPYVYQSLGMILPQFIGIGVSSLIVTSAGISVFGQYSMLYALIAVIYGVLGSALDVNYQRTCDSLKSSSVLSTKLVVWMMALPVLIALAMFFDFSLLALGFLFTGILSQQCIATLVVRHRILGSDAQSVLPRLLPVLIFFGALYLLRPSGLQEISLFFTIAWMLISLIYLLPHYRKIKLNIRNAIQSVRDVAPIWVSLLLTQVYGNIDLYVIKLFHSDEVVGAYKLAYTFAGAAMPVASVFSFIFLSKISKVLAESDHARIRVVIRQQVLINITLGLGLIIFMIILFPYVASYLYGAAGEAAVTTARILAVAIALNMLTMVFSYVLLALHMDKLIAMMTIGGGIFYLIVGLVFIPEYGANGAAVAMCLTYLFLVFVYYGICKNKLTQFSLSGQSV